MGISPEYSRLRLDESLQPVVPVGDDSEAASRVLNDVFLRTGTLQDDLRSIANRHVDDAPASAAHVMDLSGVLARAVLDWIVRWPS